MSTAARNLLETASSSQYRAGRFSGLLPEINELCQERSIASSIQHFMYKQSPVNACFERFESVQHPHYIDEAAPFRSAVGLVPASSGDQLHTPQMLFPPQASRRLKGPVQFVLKLLEQWGLQKEDASKLLGFEDTETSRVKAVLNGFEELRGRDVKDRIAHLYHIRHSLSSLFQDLEVESDWLREPHHLLDGRSPLDLLLGGCMEDLLLLREYVDTAVGL